MARCGGRGRGTHRDEREAASRVDRDATRAVEPGAAAGAVAEATRAAAGERGGRPSGDVDTADTVAGSVLRCIMGEHPEEELVNRRSGRTGNRCGTYAACEAGVPSAGWRGYGGGRRTATSAKVPLGSIAMPTGRLNRALPPAPLLKPRVLPASVVVAPVAMSTRRIRWLLPSCDASCDNTH